MIDITGQATSGLWSSETSLHHVRHHSFFRHVLVDTFDHGDWVFAIAWRSFKSDFISLVGFSRVGELMYGMSTEGLVILEVSSLMFINELIDVFVC